MQTYSYLLNDSQIKKLKTTLPSPESKISSPYIDSQWKLDDCTITLYTSKKVVFQGSEAAFYAQPFESKTMDLETHAGSDEVGTGDYFGPVCVCACIVEKKNIPFLQALKIQDSKAMTDDIILSVGEKVMNYCTHSLLILNNSKYNQVQKQNNMNKIKARLHNQAFLHLSKKEKLPALVVVDQFTPEKSYYQYLHHEKEVVRNLHFETKAESKYLAVACASVIARYAFLKHWEAMSEQFDFPFPKGAGEQVDKMAAKFVTLFGEDSLSKVAKVHFKNTEKLKEYL